MSDERQAQWFSIADACSDLEAALRADSNAQAESFLEKRPDWAEDSDAALDLVYTEYITRCELYQRSLAEELCGRFPQHSADLKLQIAFDELAIGNRDHDSYPAHADSTIAGLALPAISPPAGTIGGRYELLEEIGRGGAATVYRARQIGLDRIVAIKFLDARLAGGPSLRLRFSLEGTIIARLRHPNIVQVFEVGECDGRAYLALEYCEGGTLADKIADMRPSIRETAALMRTLALAMREAHRAGIVHRDLKPANVILTAESVAKIADFGLAKLLEERSGHTRTGTILGTPCYMAPEQIADSSENIGPAADVYSLGAILYELLTGRPPFCGATPMATLRRVQSEEPAPPRRLNRAIPRDLETICLKCLRKLPHERYASAAQLADDLQRFLENRPVNARPISWPIRLGRHARRRPAIWGLAATLLLSLCAGGAIWAWNSYQLDWQRTATTKAFQAAFREVLYAYQMAREGVVTTNGTVPFADSKRNEISQRFGAFLDKYSDEVPVRRDVVHGYKCLVMLHREHNEHDLAKGYATMAIDLGLRYVRERLSGEFSDARRNLGVSYYDLGELNEYLGNEVEAMKNFRLAIDTGQRLLDAGETKEVTYTRLMIARSHRRIAHLLRPTDCESSVKEFKSACREYRTIASQSPGDVSIKLGLANNLIEMANSMKLVEPTVRVLAVFEEARQICEDAKPTNDQDQCLATRQHADACIGIAQEHNPQDFDTADRWYERAVASLEQCVAKQPHSVPNRRRLAQVQSMLGKYYGERQRWSQAVASFLGAIEQCEQLLTIDPTNQEDRGRMEACRRQVSEIQGAAGQLSTAR